MPNSEESSQMTRQSAYTNNKLPTCRLHSAGPESKNRMGTHTRFIESEADLDSALKQFLPLTQNPPLFYPELVKSGSIALLANLLSHENTDIAIDVIEVIQELTDEDVGAEVDDLAEEEGEGDGGEGGMATKTRMAMGELIDELVSGHSYSPLLIVWMQRRFGALSSVKAEGVYSRADFS